MEGAIFQVQLCAKNRLASIGLSTWLSPKFASSPLHTQITMIKAQQCSVLANALKGKIASVPCWLFWIPSSYRHLWPRSNHYKTIRSLVHFKKLFFSRFFQMFIGWVSDSILLFHPALKRSKKTWSVSIISLLSVTTTLLHNYPHLVYINICNILYIFISNPIPYLLPFADPHNTFAHHCSQLIYLCSHKSKWILLCHETYTIHSWYWR